MTKINPPGEVTALRERLSRFRQASLRINESLDFDTVLQEVVDAARSLTDSRYGALTVPSEAGQTPHFIVSGLTLEEHQGLWDLPEGRRFFQFLGSVYEPLRVSDIASHLRALNLPEFRPPVPLHALLVAPIRHQGEGVGVIYLAHGDPGREFRAEDEETLVMFASQAALVIANASRHRDERRARAGLEALVNTSPVGVVVFDVRTGTPASFNREARRLAEALCNPDQSPEDLLDTLTIRRADGREEALAKLPLVRLMSAGETVRAEEITLIAADGRSVTALLNATPIRAGDGNDGNVESYVVTLQDLTALEELGRLRAEFLGMVSQQLRTPLAAVRGAVDTLLEHGAELEFAESRQFHRIIRDQSDRMRRLIGDLLDVARIETGTLAVTPSPVEVAELVEDARQWFLSRCGRRGVEVEVALEPNLPPVLADGWRMAQALGHLLSQVAAGLLLGSPVIQVTPAREGLYVAIAVAAQRREDPSDEPPRRLGRFPQVEVEGDDQGGDVGLSLAVCRGIVEAHGGRLRVENAGQGPEAVFTITVPAAEWEAGVGVAASETVRSRGAAQDRLRVLAVDDNPQALRYLRDALWNAGHFPIATGDPEEIPHLIERERPHVVLLDATLTGHDGIMPELVHAILETADAPVILVTASGQEDVMAHALDLGVSDYLVKPFSPSELTARIRAALRRHDDPHMAASSRPYVLGDLTIDYAARRVSLAGSAVALTPNEYRLLAELAVHAGRTVAYDQLLQRVWSPGRRGQRWLLREVVKRIRGKLGDDANNPAYVYTVPRAGYRMGPAQDA